MSRRIVIFGANSAIAAEVARRLAARGDRLFLVGRNPEKLARLVHELGPAVAGSCSADLDLLEENAALVDAASEALGGLDLAFLAHGDLGDQLRSEREVAHAEQILRTNLASPVSLLIPLANAFEAQGHGRLAVITSVAGIRGRPRNFTYGAAKGGLSRYLEGLRSRLYDTEVRTLDIRLGPVDTPMTEGHAKNALFGEVGPVAAGIVEALDGRRAVVYLPGIWRWVMLVVRLLPQFVFQRFGFLAGR